MKEITLDQLAVVLRNLGTGGTRSLIERRRIGRPALEIGDEYDLQDVVECILRSLYLDVRREEPTESSAGTSSRMDWLIADLGVAVEVKVTRPGRGEVDIKTELLADINDYRGHRGVKAFVAAIYDLAGTFVNPEGFERDLSQRYEGLAVRVLVIPWTGPRKLDHIPLSGSGLGCLSSTDAAVATIQADRRRLRSVRLLVLNGGSSLHALLGAMEGRLSSQCILRILIFDTDSTRLVPQRLIDGSERGYIESLRGIVVGDPIASAATLEYLVQASELGAWTNEPHENQIDRAKERLNNFARLVKQSRVRIILRQTPRWVVGRVWILDDVGFFTPYFQPYKLAPVLTANRGNELFSSLSDHFDYIWGEASREPKSLLFQTGPRDR